MKTPTPFTLPLAVALMLSTICQQSSACQQPTTTSQSNSPSPLAQNADLDQQASHEPLGLEHKGFWGTVNPLARKKYVQRHLSPIRNRVNELDDLTAANARAIKDMDARIEDGIRQASARAEQADRHALEAADRAQQANQTAQQAGNRLKAVEQLVGNLDQYHLEAQIEIRLRPGQTAPGANAKEALDVIASDLRGKKGYIVEVRGYSSEPGQKGIDRSQAVTNAVVRYLVEKNKVPAYRIFAMGLGHAELRETKTSNVRPATGDRVDISILKNSVERFALENRWANETSVTAETQGMTALTTRGAKQSVPSPEPPIDTTPAPGQTTSQQPHPHP